MNREFLLDLLETPSPSGMIKDIQIKWMEYCKSFADKIETDMIGNVYASVNPDADFKLMLAAHCDEIAFMVSRIADDGYIYFTKVGGISHKIAYGLKLEILGYNGDKVTGVFGANAYHHGGINDKDELSDIFLDCGFSDKKEAEKYVRIGDLAIFKSEPEFLFNDRISSRALDDKTGIFIIAEVLRKLSEESLDICVCAVSNVNEETNHFGGYFAGANLKPDAAIACDVTFATDYPGVSKAKHGDIRLAGGPVLAKGSPINYKLNSFFEKEADERGINLQYELTPAKTGTDADIIALTGKGVPTALISLPIRYMHYPVETAAMKDIEDQIEVMYQTIKKMKKDINLNPLD